MDYLLVLKSYVHTEQALRRELMVGVQDGQAPQQARHLLMQLADAPYLPNRSLPHCQGTFQQGPWEAGRQWGRVQTPYTCRPYQQPI